MKLVVGLGNPGNKYKSTRHNLGFMVLDSFVKNLGLSWKYSPDWVCFYAKGQDAVFAKPSTFMNNSGVAVAAIANFYKIKKEDILVVYDDVDLPFGKMRLAFDGLSAGHKGIDSIIRGLGGVEFGRLRVGIGHPSQNSPEGDKPKPLDVSDYVLQNFSDEEQKKIPTVSSGAESAISSYLADGIAATMNRFN